MGGVGLFVLLFVADDCFLGKMQLRFVRWRFFVQRMVYHGVAGSKRGNDLC